MGTQIVRYIGARQRRVIGGILIACAGAAVFGLRNNEQKPGSTLSSDDREGVIEGPRAENTRARARAATGAKHAVSTGGLVRARGGRALAGATVCVVTPSAEDGISEQCVATDSSGRFEFARVLADARSLLASALGYRSREQVLEQDTALNEDVIIELEPGGENLSGQVVDASGGPVRSAMVTLRGNSDAVIGAALSGSDGRFELTESPGVLEVCAQAEAYSRTCREIAGPSDEHILVLTPESRIMGRVLTRPGGDAVAGASVIAWNRNGLHIPARTTSSADDGSFTIAGLPAGGYDVVAVGEDSRSADQWVVVGLGETAAPITLWAAPAVRVSGLVLAAGEPCGGGSVHLSGPVWAQEPVAADGTVQLDGVTPGRYDATADCEHALSQTVSLEVGSEPVEHVWALEKLGGSWETNEAALRDAPTGGTIRATVEGELTAVVGVFVDSEESGPRRGRRNGSSFVFEKLLAGEYRVYVNDDFEQAQRARISGDGEVVEVQLRLAEPSWISGRVLSDDGMPVPDAWVSASRSDAPMAATVAAPPTLTDDNGAFNLAGVPGALYSLRVASPSGDARLDGVKVDDEVLIRVLPPASLSGRVLTAEGQSVPEFTLTYRELHDPRGHERRGAHSSFHLPMLQPGAYSLQVSSPLGSALREVQLRPRESFTVTMTLTDSETVSTTQ